jgi:hypothetical protein
MLKAILMSNIAIILGVIPIEIPGKLRHNCCTMERVLYFNSMIEPKGGLFSAPVIILLVTFIAVIILFIVLTYGILYSIKNTTLTLTNTNLIIKSAFHRRKIPLENIHIDGIKTVNLNEDREFAVSYRTFGTHLPNLNMGWMKLNNGTKALTFITDKDNVILIPTDGFSVLFSMDNIEDFIKQIKSGGEPRPSASAEGATKK